MTISQKNICLVAAFAATANWINSQPVPTTKPIATLVLNALDAPVKSGSSVRLKILLTNVSESDISVELWEKCRIDVIDEKGSPAPEYGRGAMLNHHDLDDAARATLPPTMSSKAIYHRFKPGETWQFSQDIAERYRPLSPGKYTVQAHTSAYVWATNKGVPIDSNQITITVIE